MDEHGRYVMTIIPIEKQEWRFDPKMGRHKQQEVLTQKEDITRILHDRPTLLGV
jgi:hypothetical protein